MINAIIMASGKSERMGKNKLLLPFDNKPLIAHTIELVINSKFSDSILVSNDKTVLEIGKSLGIRVVYNDKAHLGQSESIKLGIKNTNEALGYAFFPGDQPLMDVTTVNSIMEKFCEDNDRLVVPKYQDNWGNPVIFPKRCLNDLLSLEGDVGGKVVIKKNIDKLTFFEVNCIDLLLDIDTIADYEKLIKHIKSN